METLETVRLKNFIVDTVEMESDKESWDLITFRGDPRVLVGQLCLSY